VIFPSHGGRFPVAREETTRLAAALREPLGALSPAWPVPAGGIDVESVPRLRRDYGDDTVLLVGSSLYTRSTDLASNARRFVELVSQGPAGGPRTG
jgi:ribulose-bisphosphate carboxylase large chain